MDNARNNGTEITEGMIVFEAARHNDIANLQRFLKFSKESNWTDPNPTSNSPAGTPLYQAVKLGLPEVAKVLISYEADTDYKHNGRELSYYANLIKNPDTKISILNVLGGAANDGIDSCSMDELNKAIFQKNINTLRCNIEYIKNFSDGAKLSILKSICNANFSLGLELFGQSGISLDAVDSKNQNLLHSLCVSESKNEDEYDRSIRTLLKYGADIHCTSDNFFETPLNKAIKFRNIFAVKALIKAGADVNFVDKDGLWSPMAVATHNYDEEIIKTLLNSNLVSSSISDNVKTYFLNAGKFDIFQKFAENGLVDSDFRVSQKIIKKLFYSGNFDAFSFLISNGYINSNFKIDGVSPLLFLCDIDFKYSGVEFEEWESTRFASILIENGADVNERNDQGWSSIMLAARRRHYFLMTLLLCYKANLEYKSVKGKSVYDYIDENSILFFRSWKEEKDTSHVITEAVDSFLNTISMQY